MTENECLSIMVPPSAKRKVWHGGVMQIWLTRACDKKCFGCTQLSQLAGAKPAGMSLAQVETALRSLDAKGANGYFGVVGAFGGNPCLHPQFEAICELYRRYVPKERCGLWANKLFGHGAAARETFNPAVSNLNVHQDADAWDEFRSTWPEAMPFGLESDSRHSPPWVAMKDLDVLPNGENTEANRLDLISGCDINRNWSAMIGVFRGELRGWFCEIAGSMSMIHQGEAGYPDTGIHISSSDGAGAWWRLPMTGYAGQVREHCHACGVPLKGFGSLANGGAGAKEQVSASHAGVFRAKDGREVELVTELSQLGSSLARMTDYIGNASNPALGGEG